MGASRRSSRPPGFRATRWLLVLSLVHSLPTLWLIPVAGGLAPNCFLLWFGLASMFNTDQGSLALGGMVLAQSLGWCLIYYLVAHLATLLVWRLRRPWLRTGLLLGLLAAQVGMALFPVYSSGGHSGSYRHTFPQLLGLLKDYQLSAAVVFGYPLAMLLILTLLLVWQHLPLRMPRWPGGAERRRVLLRRGQIASVLIFLILFVYVHRVLLVYRPLAVAGWAVAQVIMARALSEQPGSEFRSERSVRDWLELAAAQGHVEAARELAALARSAEEKRRWLQLAADRGDLPSQYDLYRLLRRDKEAGGRGEALNWLQLAAKGGHGEAQFELASYYLAGAAEWGLAVDRGQARRWLEAAAQSENGRAMEKLAGLYRQGSPGFAFDAARAAKLWGRIAEGYAKGRYGFEENPEQADLWRRRAAEVEALLEAARRGEPAAQAELGWQMLRSPEPGPGGRQQGIAWLEKAASGGDAELQYQLGAMFMFGNFQVAKDPQRGHRWWDEAAGNKHVRTMKYLASGYLNGNYHYPVDLLKARALARDLADAYRDGLLGVDPDPVEARRWEAEIRHVDRLIDLAGGSYLPPDELRTRAEGGDLQAQYQLARQLLIAGMKYHPEGARWLIRAAEAGHHEAQYQLVISYENTIHFMREYPARGLEFLQQAAAGGHPQAMAALALAYEKGRYGLTRDLPRARELYELIVQGHESGREGWKLEERFVAFQRSRLQVIDRLTARSAD